MTASHHIVFGAGPLGRANATALLAQGQRVTVASRTGHMAAAPPGAEHLTLDLLDTATATQACKGASAIYLCAQPPYHRWPQLFAPLLESSIAIAAATGARLVVADNLYGYGPAEGPLTEDLPLAPTTRKGRVRAAMHRALVAAHAAGRIDYAVARGADLFGPWVIGSTFGERVFTAIARGRTVTLVGNPDLPHSITFADDFGRALAILGTDGRASGGTWHVPNTPATSQRAFVERAFARAGQPAHIRVAGRIELALIGVFVPPVREMIEMLPMFERPLIVDHARFAATFGDIATPLDSALDATLAWTRTNAAR